MEAKIDGSRLARGTRVAMIVQRPGQPAWADPTDRGVVLGAANLDGYMRVRWDSGYTTLATAAHLHALPDVAAKRLDARVRMAQCRVCDAAGPVSEFEHEGSLRCPDCLDRHPIVDAEVRS